uniref:Small ribosomal subunit protein uS4c n=1 Tax=Halimeda discoidea TaxID=118222 RepID=A0A1C9JB50_9CHLO|nr:ribosomal protein S4 [Halimeda discoidea]
MSRYRGPRTRLVKRLGSLPGYGRKFVQEQQNKNKRKKKQSPFTIRLKEKQKLRYNYGLTEKKLLQYVKIARKQKISASAGETLLRLLELRLDNIVFQLGFAPTLPAARQLITHGHVLLNGKKKDIPSYQCNINDLITLTQKIQKQKVLRVSIPKFLNLDSQNLVGKIQQYPSRFGLVINELIVIEYYSRNL